MEEPRPRLQKALRILAVLLLIFSILCFVIVAFTFVTSFFIGGQIISDGTGIMRLLMRVNQHGKHAIDSALFGFAWLPGLGAFCLARCASGKSSAPPTPAPGAAALRCACSQA